MCYGVIQVIKQRILDEYVCPIHNAFVKYRDQQNLVIGKADMEELHCLMESGTPPSITQTQKYIFLLPVIWNQKTRTCNLTECKNAKIIELKPIESIWNPEPVEYYFSNRNASELSSLATPDVQNLRKLLLTYGDPHTCSSGNIILMFIF